MRIAVRAISTLTIVVLSSFSPAHSVQDLCVRVESSTLHWFPPSIRSEVGTGICIGEQCSVVLTPYHMQLTAGGKSLEVIGGQVAKVLSAATTTDGDKSEIRLGDKLVSYNIGNDFSFLLMKRKVRHKIRAVPHYRPNVGELVYVAGYYGRKFQIQETRLIGVNVPLMIGQNELKQNLVLDVALMPGSSGSAVLDKYNRLLGMIVVTGKLKLHAGSLSGVSVAFLSSRSPHDWSASTPRLDLHSSLTFLTKNPKASHQPWSYTMSFSCLIMLRPQSQRFHPFPATFTTL
jgi:hypothetical protein